MRRRGFLAAALALLATAPIRALAQPGEPDLTMLEPIAGVAATPEGIVIQVMAGACGGKPDFAWYVERSPGRIAIAFARKAIHACRPSRSVPLTFSYTELGVERGAPLTILNPVRAAETPPRPRRSARPRLGKR